MAIVTIHMGPYENHMNPHGNNLGLYGNRMGPHGPIFGEPLGPICVHGPLETLYGGPQWVRMGPTGLIMSLNGP